ncbi:MAG: hypothetical protein KDC85_05385 [Saprospiraceae bacterium]|nr:hypothetical protein [Saprospiraceae bacterium]MCB9324968.1 hypothetical protein [Lewinellaceae bacterium]
MIKYERTKKTPFCTGSLFAKICNKSHTFLQQTQHKKASRITPTEVGELTSYIISLKDTNPEKAKFPQGKKQ